MNPLIISKPRQEEEVTGGRRRWREVYSKKAMSEVDAGRDRATPAARHWTLGAIR